MKRLTDKTNDKRYPYVYLDIDDRMIGTPINKLGTLEDKEEDLGIELTLFVDALINGIYDKRRYYQGSCLSLSNGNIGLYINELDRLFPFDRYGIDWALTKEELE